MKTLILASAAALALFVSGCGATGATITKTSEWSGQRANQLEVLLDSQLAKPFEVVAELSADAIESPHSIKRVERHERSCSERRRCDRAPERVVPFPRLAHSARLGAPS